MNRFPLMAEHMPALHHHQAPTHTPALFQPQSQARRMELLPVVSSPHPLLPFLIRQAHCPATFPSTVPRQCHPTTPHETCGILPELSRLMIHTASMYYTVSSNAQQALLLQAMSQRSLKNSDSNHFTKNNLRSAPSLPIFVISYTTNN